MDSRNVTLAGGLPHSDIHGSKPARGSPWLFAACHVLHRLLVPRHPPNALIILRSSGRLSVASGQTTRVRPPAQPPPPCTETIVRDSRQVSAAHRQASWPARPERSFRWISIIFDTEPGCSPFLEENGPIRIDTHKRL